MEWIEGFLKEREKHSELRVLLAADRKENGYIYFNRKKYIDLSSNDYLGLSNHPDIKKASAEAIETFGTSTCASRLLSGSLKIHEHLEEEIARFKGKESGLVFNSGYQANVSVISSLFGKQDAIFFDRLVHASIIDGIILSGAKMYRFPHNNPEELNSLLKKERNKFKNALIVTETVFSMDGDICPLKDLVSLKYKYGCVLMVDEAHATGIFGKNGAGIVEKEGLNRDVDIIMGTFSKALGSFGAYITCSKKTRDYLVNACRGFIYSTSLPASVIAANIASLKIVKEEPDRRISLLKNAEYLRLELKKKGFYVKGSTQIIPIITGDGRKTVEMGKKLMKKGYWLLPIRHPTVPKGEERLRVSLTCRHTGKILKKLCDDISILF